jgi:hypothetical protein
LHEPDVAHVNLHFGRGQKTAIEKGKRFGHRGSAVKAASRRNSNYRQFATPTEKGQWGQRRLLASTHANPTRKRGKPP